MAAWSHVEEIDYVKYDQWLDVKDKAKSRQTILDDSNFAWFLGCLVPLMVGTIAMKGNVVVLQKIINRIVFIFTLVISLLSKTVTSSVS